MSARSLRLSHIRGIEVRLSLSLPLFALLVLWVFAARFADAHGLVVAGAMGVSGMVLFFASILAHELGHALEARHRDLDVVGITLSMFGGVTEMHAQNQTARDELAVAAIGPYISLLCAALFGLVATFAPDLLPALVGAPVAEVAGLLGWINVALAAFNVVPGAPLDGGRVLRAALWWILGDRHRAVIVAARVGQVLWVALIAGAVVAYQYRDDLRFSAVLLALVAFFLLDGARREITNARLEALYTGRSVGDLLGSLPSPVPADRSIELVEPLTAHGHAAGSQLVLVTDGAQAVGLLDLDQAASVHAAERSMRTAGDLAQPLDDLPVVDVSEDLHGLVERFQGESTVVVVHRDGQPIGAVTEREAAQALGRLRAGGRTGRERRTASPRSTAGS